MRLRLCLSFPLVVTSSFVSERPIFRRPSSSLGAKKEATFGMGCFWKPSETLLKTEGVLDTVVGYTGKPSAAKPPSYDAVCFSRDWVEGVRVTYDDSKVAYRELLDAFFEAQEPKLGSRQYASIIFPHDNEQKEVAEEWVDSGIREKRVRPDGVPVAITQVEDLSPFYRAEGYHQRYWQKQRPRFAIGGALLAISSGLVDSIVPEAYHSLLHSGANGAVLIGCAYVLLERVVDTKVVKLETP